MCWLIAIKTMKRTVLLVLSFQFFLTSCSDDKQEMTGPTIGRITVGCDESLKDIISQEEQIFERTYKYASLDITFTSDFDLFNQFFSDSLDAIVASRTLSQEELNRLEQKQIYPRQYAFATSAIAFIQKKSDLDSNYTYEQLTSALKDESQGKIFVIESNRSGIPSFLFDVLDTTSLPKHIFALRDKEEILEYIIGQDNAIGIIDWSDISDSDAAYSKLFLQDISLIGISNSKDSIQGNFLRPFQYHLQDNNYPFTRDLYLINKSGVYDVGTGFAFFMCGEIGQKIILKAGLLPKFQTERTIELKNTTDVTVIK